MPKTRAANPKKSTQESNYRRTYKRVTAFMQKRPFSSFFIALAALLVIIIAGNLLNKPKITKPSTNTAKQVRIYAIGEAPKVTVQGKIIKSGVVKISAQSSGIVQNIAVKEGDSVPAGATILSLSSNYQGGNAPALQAQIAQQQYQNVVDTYGEQTDNINKQKDIARNNAENAIDLQNLNATAATASASLINYNQGILNGLVQTLTTLQPSDPAYQQTQSAITQLSAAQNQLTQSQSQIAYQGDANNPPAKIASTQKDLTLQQLDIQQKALDLNKSISQLQAQLAEVSAANMSPASPFAGTVERVYVNIGQSVSQGTLLAAIVSPNVHSTVEVDVPQNIAQNISRLEASNLSIGTHIYSVRPTFVSTEATTGSLYSILYTIPQDDNTLVTDGSYIKVEIPVGAPSTGAAVPFIPLDAVYQSQDASYLLVDTNGTAQVRQVTLGQIYGSYVEITNGLKSGDQVILDRNVVSGDKVNNTQ
jgi:RND family efflux transporter MFP subunit